MFNWLLIGIVTMFTFVTIGSAFAVDFRVGTITMNTYLIASVKWIDVNPDEFDELYDAAAKAVPNVLKQVVTD